MFTGSELAGGAPGMTRRDTKKSAARLTSRQEFVCILRAI
jgi:hypothetical protein